jgi:hypothetical protein
MRSVTAALVLTALLSGCATGPGPGAPVLRADEADGEGPMLIGCSNVSRKTQTAGYIVDSYLSTWDSAVREGTFPQVAAMLDATPRSDIFCMSYAASPRKVSRIVAQTLPLLGYPIQQANEATGNFETGFVARQHAMARWRDRYLISVHARGADRTVVRIYRDLFISRPFGGSYSDYNQARSVGHNEAWILLRIAKELGER